MRNEEHDKLLSGRVKARFSDETLRRASRALGVTLRAVFDGVPENELDEAVDAYRLLRGLKVELDDLAHGSRPGD